MDCVGAMGWEGNEVSGKWDGGPMGYGGGGRMRGATG